LRVSFGRTGTDPDYRHFKLAKAGNFNSISVPKNQLSTKAFSAYRFLNLSQGAVA
jgi:hypothetical protein